MSKVKGLPEEPVSNKSDFNKHILSIINLDFFSVKRAKPDVLLF